MAGVHGIQHVEGFGATDLPHDDPGGSHPQGLADQLADADLAGGCPEFRGTSVAAQR
jgi:hypothetical protein